MTIVGILRDASPLQMGLSTSPMWYVNVVIYVNVMVILLFSIVV